ncbi:hypothetical protein LCGC14_0759770 [marine sediment metagenome]|uniref:Uncharacterized protein n=1 Tax=marine sediment metagenome TaxID=412755 RepID=A0A0F9QLG0_9ZZZZ
MQGQRFVIHVELGTLAANTNGFIALPFACQLIAVAAVGDNAHTATFDLGTVADPDGILDGKAPGVSDAGAYYYPADFNGAVATAGQPFPIAAEGELAWSVDFDGPTNTTAIQKASIDFWFAE